MLEHDDLLRIDFQETFQIHAFPAGLSGVTGGGGIAPAPRSLSKCFAVFFNRLLPSAMAVTDSSRLMIALFAHSRDVERFLRPAAASL